MVFGCSLIKGLGKLLGEGVQNPGGREGGCCERLST